MHAYRGVSGGQEGEGRSGVEIYEVSWQRTNLLKEPKVEKISGDKTNDVPSRGHKKKEEKSAAGQDAKTARLLIDTSR